MLCSPTFSFIPMQAGPLPHHLEQGQTSQLHHFADYPSLHSLLFLLQKKKEKNNIKNSISGHLGETFHHASGNRSSRFPWKVFLFNSHLLIPFNFFILAASRGCAAPHTSEGPHGCPRLGTGWSLQDNGSKLTSFLHSCACWQDEQLTVLIIRSTHSRKLVRPLLHSPDTKLMRNILPRRKWWVRVM